MPTGPRLQPRLPPFATLQRPHIHAQTAFAISAAFSELNSLSTIARPKSNAVPAPREVIRFPSTTTRSPQSEPGSSSATEKCAV
jgi:hypothetical protein